MNNLSKLQSEAVKEFNRLEMDDGDGCAVCLGEMMSLVNLKLLKDFLTDQIQKAVEETRKEDVKTINEIIQMSNENSSTEWFDGLRCAKESIKGLSIQSKGK
jgi:hypothetical protein